VPLTPTATATETQVSTVPFTPTATATETADDDQGDSDDQGGSDQSPDTAQQSVIAEMVTGLVQTLEHLIGI